MSLDFRVNPLDVGHNNFPCENFKIPFRTKMWLRYAKCYNVLKQENLIFPPKKVINDFIIKYEILSFGMIKVKSLA